jgi:prepilin peptidase CpaA
MIVAAVIDGWTLKVPNWLTFPLILSGWLLGGLNDLGWLPAETVSGGFAASLATTMLGFIFLYPVHVIGGMGAGDVKMQMGFGAWIGAFYGYNANLPDHSGSLWILTYSFCLAVMIGGVLGALMIVIRGKYQENLANTRAILADLGGGVDHAAAKAAERKPKMHLLPYGIPLCLGFLSYLIYQHGL